MREAVLVDTGPLYAAIDPSDVQHRRALSELQKLARNRREVLVSSPILLEAYSLVRRRFDPNIAFGWLAEIGEATLVYPTPQDYRHAMAKVQTYVDQPITLFDATLAILALRMKLQVWTYDHHFDVMRVPVWR
jgi:predicted nucleic acid-binding protein